MSEQKTVDVVVDRKTWLRGEGSYSSFLLRPNDGKMCCLGFACKALGLRDHEIELVGEPCELDWDHPLRRADVKSLVVANDDTDITDDTREARLIEDGQRIGLNFSFIN